MKISVTSPETGIAATSFFFQNSNDEFWNGTTSVFEEWNSANYDSYAIAGSADLGGGIYECEIPVEVAALPSWRYVCRKFVDGTFANDYPLVGGDNSVYILSLINAKTTLINTSGPIGGDDGDTNTGTFYAYNSLQFDKDFSNELIDVSGSDVLAFLVKRNTERDADEDSLILIASGVASDGLLIRNASALNIDERPNGSVIATGANSVAVSVKAEGFTIPPSPDAAPYDFEIVFWKDGAKHRFAHGKLVVERTVWRNVLPPE